MLPAHEVDAPRRRGGWLFAAIAVVGAASAIALALLVYRAFLMVQTGRGLETYRTVWLVEFNWIGALVFSAALLAALVLGLILRWLHKRREAALWSELSRKHGSSETGV